MFGIVHFPLFISAVFLLNVTPGPDTAYIVGRSLAQGRSAGLMSVFGISVGCCVHTLACAFGLTALLAASPLAFSIIKCAGAIYLIYLGARLVASLFIKTAGSHLPHASPQAKQSLKQLFFQGFWTNVLNPKVILFFVAFFPQFVAAESTHKPFVLLELGAIFVLMSIIWNGLVAWVAGGFTARLGNRPAIKKWLEGVVGSVFIGLGIRLVTAPL